jgi:hypothetical protein
MTRKREKPHLAVGLFPFFILSSEYQAGGAIVPSLLGRGFVEDVDGTGFMGLRYFGAGGGRLTKTAGSR